MGQDYDYETLEKDSSGFEKRIRKFKIIGVLLVVFGILLIAAGFFVGFYFPSVINKGLEDQATVCSESSDGYDEWQNNQGSDDTPLWDYLYIYQIKNPEAYIQDGDALILYEEGPYVFRQYTYNYDVTFYDNSTVSYKIWYNYVAQDGSVDGFEDLSCDGCKITDSFTFLNAPYNGFLTAVVNEGNFFLQSYGCTTTQIGLSLKIGLIIKECTAAEIGTSTNCGCCVIGGSCDVIYGPTSSITAMISLLSYWDGGVVSEYLDTVNAFGATELYSELVQTKSVSEFSYGYPNALLGYVGALIAASSGDVPALETLASYTTQVGEVCSDFCVPSVFPALLSCAGTAAPAYEQPDNLAYLGGTTCLTYTATYLAFYICSSQSVNDTACACADGGDWASRKGCCLASGSFSAAGLSTLTGIGCLAEMPGSVNTRNLLTLEASMNKTDKMQVENTGCDDIDLVTNRYVYNGESRYNQWSTPDGYVYPDMPQPTQSDVIKAKAQDSYTSITTVSGGDGMIIPPTKITSSLFSSDLSDGKAKNDSYAFFITEVTRPIRVYYSSQVRTKGILTARFKASLELLEPNEVNLNMGVGVPYNGLQNLYYQYLLPSYITRPNYLYGDSYLFTQSDNSDKNATDGGGISIYQAYPYEANAVALTTPLLLTSDIVLANSDDYDTFLDIEPASGRTIYAHKKLGASVSVWDCDPSSETSCYIFPDSKAGCYGTTAEAMGQTAYPCSAANILSPKVKGGKVIPLYWIDEWSVLTDSQANDFKEIGSLNQAAGIMLVMLPVIGFLFVVTGAFGLYKLWKFQSNASLL